MIRYRVKRKGTELFLGEDGFSTSLLDQASVFKSHELPDVKEAIRILRLAERDPAEFVATGRVDPAQVRELRAEAFSIIVSIGTQAAQKTQAIANKWIRKLEGLSDDLRAELTASEDPGSSESIEYFLAMRNDVAAKFMRGLSQKKAWEAISSLADLAIMLDEIVEKLEGRAP